MSHRCGWQFDLGHDRAAEALAQFEAALESAAERVRENPLSARAKRDLRVVHDQAGQAALASGQWQEAVRHFATFLTLVGRRDPAVLCDLARAHHSRGRSTLAIELAEEALRGLEGKTDADAASLRSELEENLRVYRAD